MFDKEQQVNKTSKFAAVAVFVAMALSLTGAVFANTEQQLENVRQQIQEQQGKVNKAQERVESISGKLQKLQEAYEEAVEKYKKIQDRLTVTEALIEDNQEILRGAEKRLAERNKILHNRVRDIYKNGHLNYIDVIFGATDFSDFINRVEILQRIIRQDISLIAEVKRERETVLQKKAELDKEHAEVLQLKKEAEEQKELIAAKKQEQQKFLDQMVNERSRAEQALQELQQTSQEIEQRLRGSGHSGSSQGTGTMAWPLHGEITSPFGYRTHPIFGTKIYHSGIDIAADTGDSIRAADSGVIESAGWLGGYGYAVIINHGNGIATLYGHNSELLVSEGQRVAKGQVISRAGSTGWSTGPHLHFEVRQDGSPVNPLNFLS